MSEDRKMVIHFNNGKKLRLDFPTQIKSSMGALVEGMKKLLETEKLVIEADGQLIIIPWSSVERLEVSPMPSAASLPFGAIKNAKIVPLAGSE